MLHVLAEISMIKPKEIDIGFKINHKKLWQLDIPVEEIELSELNSNMDFPYLEKEGTDDWNLTPRQLIANFNEEHTHAEKVNKANLKFPIEIYFHHGNWIILDGVHRFVKAKRYKLRTIKVKKVSQNLLETVKVGV